MCSRLLLLSSLLLCASLFGAREVDAFGPLLAKTPSLIRSPLAVKQPTSSTSLWNAFATVSKNDTEMDVIHNNNHHQQPAPASPHELQDGEDDFLHWFRFNSVGRLYLNDDNDDDEQSTNGQPEDAILHRLQSATVAIVSLGGIGSWTAEALCRSGIGHLVLIDLDDICISNTNRQLHTLSTNVGVMKTEAMKERLLQIQPHCTVSIVHDFVLKDNVQDMVQGELRDVDIVIDTIDQAEEKAALMAACANHGKPIVTVGNPAGKLDPTQIAVEDLALVTHNQDELLGECHDQLCQEYGFQPGKWGIPSVYSKEQGRRPKQEEVDNHQSSFRNDGILGTACFVTGSFGFVAASRVVEMIARQTLVAPTRS